MEQLFMPPEQPFVRKGLAKRAMREASARVQERGVLFSMIVSLLLILLVGVASYVLFGTASMLVGLCLPGVPTLSQIFWSELCLVAGFALAFLCFVMPFVMGRLRMAGMLAAGMRPAPAEMLYYFTSRRRYVRSLAMSIQLLLGLCVPFGVSYGCVTALAALWNRVLRMELDDQLAFALLLALIPVALFLCLLTFFLCSSFLPSLAVAIGNEEIGTFRAIAVGVSHGWRAKWQMVAFLWRTLLHVLLSLLTLGVLYVFYYSHHTTIAYMHLSMVLCPKGDTQ